MKQTVVMFCYRGEEEILPITVNRIRTVLPMATIHLFDDDKDPLPSHVSAGLTEMAGVFYETTTFDRQRNLNGPECIRGELACMQRAAIKDDNETGIIIKMDPDTLILRAEAIVQLLAQGCKFITGTSEKGIFSGMFYAMTRDILDTVKHHANLISFHEHAAEDECIGALAYIAVNRQPYKWFNVWLPEMRKYFAAFDVTKAGTPQYQEDIEFVARHGHIITVGNTGINHLPPYLRIQAARDLLRAFDRQSRENMPQAVQSAPAAALAASQVAPATTPKEASNVSVREEPRDCGNDPAAAPEKMAEIAEIANKFPRGVSFVKCPTATQLGEMGSRRLKPIPMTPDNSHVIPMTVDNSHVIPMTVDDRHVIPMTVDGEVARVPMDQVRVQVDEVIPAR